KNRSAFQKIQVPPKSIEEFLKLQNWDYWPKEIHLIEDKYVHDMNKIKEDSSFTSIYTHLLKNVPQIFEADMNMELRLRECSLLLQDHASKIFEWDKVICKTRYEKLERYKAFLEKYHTHKKIMLADEMGTQKNIEGCNFSGFKANELTQLPRHLDAKRIYLFILKAHDFDERIFKIWKSHFLSESSIALLHDSFWWWFLHKFKPNKKNQDCLFDRISESYVTLFISIPLRRKDAFFQVYPDCLAQAIYATFREAFPESSNLFNDEFKEDLGNNIFLWMSGLKPRKGFWVHWKLKDLSTTTIHGSKRATEKSIKERIASSQEHIISTIDFDFDMTKFLKKPTANAISTVKEDSKSIIKQSHYGSIGPEFYCILFNLGGQSPLILYYLQRNKLAGFSKVPRQIKIKFTEILHEPYPFPTYRDIIKEAKRQFLKNQKDFRIEKQIIDEEIKHVRQRHRRIVKELDRLYKKATKKPLEVKKDLEKFLQGLGAEAKIERELVASLSTSSSSSSTENYNFEEKHL
uniref:Family with sequence similarity 227 member B n=1 Tax=Marmota marmota marmota TaxID=9994 RepID=A0A8C5ZRB3_MARMA